MTDSNMVLPEAVEKWVAAVEALDVQKTVEMYAENGNLMGTVAATITESSTDIKTYFSHFLDCESIRGQFNSLHTTELSENTILITGDYTFFRKPHGEDEQEIKANYTYVLVMEGGVQKIQHHSSRKKPEGEGVVIYSS